MTKGTDKITRKLTSRRNALLLAYNEKDLHQLRVNIRRARALLRPRPDKQSAALRKEWGRLAEKTNAARDWDTLALYAAKALPARHWHSLQPLVEDQRARAHQRVLATLQSAHWDETLAQWNKLVKQAGKGAFAEDTMSGGNRRAAESALKSSRRALQRGDERSWHKLRIAVKNLRYKLDNTSLAGDRESGELKAIRKMCKHLQNALGDWHDTVVHRSLLAEIAEDFQFADDSEAGQALEATIEARRRESLKHVTSILARDGQLLAAAAKIS